jgi:hypothetical protein
MRRFWLVCLLTALNLISRSQDISQIIAETNPDSLVNTVRVLTGEDSVYVSGEKVLIKSRANSSPGGGNDLAADYIKARYIRYGLTVEDQVFSSTGRNIIATQTGINTPDSIYIICAHYDAVTSYCADDNASGVAAVLEAARILSEYCFDYTIIYASWDYEEDGQLGSQYYAQQAYANGDKIAGVLNMDMIGYDSNDDRKFEIHTNSFTSSLALKNALVSTISNYSLSLDPVVVNPGATGSDHGPFWTRGYGAVCVSELFFHGDANPYYHSSNDRISHFNLNYFKELARVNIGTLATISKLNPLCNGASIVDELDAGSSLIKIYPNPVQDNFMNLYLDRSVNHGLIEILDLEGHSRLLRELDTNETLILDLSDLKSAMYILKITSGGKVITERFLKL